MTIRLKPLEILFALFLTVAMVRVMPFGPRDIFSQAADTDTGDVGRRLLYAALFLGFAWPALRNLEWSSIRVPLSFLLLIGFALLSIGWSAVPALAFRRLALTLLVVGTILLATMQLRPRTVLDSLRIVTLALALATLISGVLYPAGAIHQPGDPEPSIVGGWRGVFGHKNSAGAIVGIALVLATEAFLRQPRRWIVGSASVGVAALALYLTHSRTSQISAGLAILVMLVFRATSAMADKRAKGAALLRMSVLLAGVAVLLAAWFTSGMGKYLLDPDAFTGRGQLWSVIAGLIAQSPWIGHGYESVFMTGDEGILARTPAPEWIHRAVHSHNGVLDLMVTVGLVGTVLYAWAMCIDPWLRIRRLPPALRTSWEVPIAGLLTYAIIHSLMEGKMFYDRSSEWMILLIILGISVRLQVLLRTQPSAPPAAGPHPRTPATARGDW